MLRVPRLLIFASTLGLILAATQPEALAAKGQRIKPTKQTKKAQPAVPIVTAPSGPLTPLTLQQTPALPAQVDFQNGQLTISARNSTLGDILRTVHTKTGANMDFPPNVTERVVGQFGPGPARDVLASLLSGSNFNYAIVGSPANPMAMDKVIITRNTGGPTPPAAAKAQFGMQQSVLQNQAAQDNESDEVDNEGVPGAPSEEMVPPDQADASPDQNAEQPQNQQVIKTPEQLLQELQRQQQIQQQQMQQQEGTPQGLPSSDQPPLRQRPQ